MNFQQLEYALAVDAHHNFGRAAEHCNITQATLSAMIKRLEEELDIVLFDRSHQPVVTTEDGKRFMPLAKEILDRKHAIAGLKATGPLKLNGALRIGIIPTIASSLLPLILPVIRKENPELRLTIDEVTTEEIVQQLKDDTIDVGILATPLNEASVDEHILYYEAMMVYGVTDGKKSYISGKDVKSGKIWLLEEGHCFRNQAMTVCDIQEKQDDSDGLRFHGSSFETLLNLTDSFGGYTLVPELYHREMPKERQVKCKAFRAPIPVREVSIVSMRPYAHRHAIEKLSFLIQNQVKPLLSTSAMRNRDLDIVGI